MTPGAHPARDRITRAAARGAAWAVLALLPVLGGCFTGERPELGAAPESTGDPAVDAVLQRLDQARTATFTAAYRIASPAGPEAEAAVAQEGTSRRAVTIGAVRYLVDGERSFTCDQGGGCVNGLDAARVSNLNVTPNFFDASPATRLRRDAAARTGPSEASTETIAGQPATCVSVPVAQTAARYCALDTGPLALMRTTDVTIELTTFSPTVDPTAFST